MSAPSLVAAPEVVTSESSTLEPKRFKWSASRLKMLLQCPRQFRYAYIDGLPRTVTAPLVFGQTLHTVIKEAHETQMSSGSFPPLTDVLECFDALWKQSVETGCPLFREGAPSQEDLATTGRQMLRLFHAGQGTRVPLVVELPFEIEVEGHQLCGVIDRVDEVKTASGETALVVIDYKSGQRKPSPKEVEGDLQLSVYALAVELMLGLPVERVSVHFLKDGLDLDSTRSEAAFDWLSREVLGYASRTLERGQYPACPGYWCRWCDFRSRCEAEGIATGSLSDAARTVDEEVREHGARR